MTHNLQHEWHVSINQLMRQNRDNHSEYGFMYEAKNACYEVPRLKRLFKAERVGTLPEVHKQCSHSEPVELEENYLTCCLGVKCKECPALQALDATTCTDEEKDDLKAWTCVAHILSQEGKCDTSEGYVLDESDKMFWRNVYDSIISR